VSPDESVDWKKRLKALGIARKRPKRGEKKEQEEDFLRKEEGKRDLRRATSGREGEDLASLLLEEDSLRILDRNVRYRDGEIDIVALDGGTTVFVEVKRRRDAALGEPAEAVTRTKRLRIVRAARRWLAAHPTRGRAVRFDVVAIVGDPPAATWIRGAFDADSRA
jgi:putative endonuclease